MITARSALASLLGATVLITVVACSGNDPVTPTSTAAASVTTDTTSAQSTTRQGPTTSATTSSNSTTTPKPAPQIMEDFVGQSEDQARTTLTALNVRIKTTKKIDPAGPGTVIEQNPVAGAPFSQDVTLTVAIAPPTVPDVTGKTFGTAQQTLVNAGFTVKEVPVFDNTLADGLVKAQDPAAGASNASEVTLSVIRRPVVEYLSDMERVPGGYASLSTGAQKANGVTYSHGVEVELSNSGDPTSIEYDLSRQYRQLQGSLALDDKSDSAAGVRVEVFGDGRSLFDQTITFGTTVPLDVDVTDVLRLKITASKVAGSRASLVLGDVEAQGLQSEIESTTTSGAPSTSTTTTTTSR